MFVVASCDTGIITIRPLKKTIQTLIVDYAAVNEQSGLMAGDGDFNSQSERDEKC
ncbi:hypothetical protein [Chitinibacter sp. S2-10]|uniref:hypothetical protein n=1 Tax=Chitinibacter sp. S2-10 TaxID=3373597 RepID=UPI0039778CBD